MSDTKPLPDDPDRTAATPAHPAPAASGPAPATGPAPTAAAPADPVPGEPVWAAQPAPQPAPEPAAHPTAGHPTAAPGPGTLRSAGSGLRGSRAGLPVLVGVIALVLGCCLGAGLVAAGAFVFGDGHRDGHRGDDRGRISRDDRAPRGPAVRGDERDGGRPQHPGKDGTRRRPSPAVPAPTAPAPASPATPSSPATS